MHLTFRPINLETDFAYCVAARRDAFVCSFGSDEGGGRFLSVLAASLNTYSCQYAIMARLDVSVGRWFMTLICRSKRLNVRQFTLDDAPFIVELLNDASFIRYIADKKVRTEQDAIEYLRHGPLASYQAHGFGLNLVERREDGEPIGMCGVLKRDELAYPDLGYAFLSRYTGQGYATEAAEAVLEATLLASGLNTVQAVTLPDNQPSNRLLEKLGFQLQCQIMLYGHSNNLYEYTRA